MTYNTTVCTENFAKVFIRFTTYSFQSTEVLVKNSLFYELHLLIHDKKVRFCLEQLLTKQTASTVFGFTLIIVYTFI